MAKGKKAIYKSAKTGRFVSEKYAAKHPNTTVSQTIKKKGKSSRGNPPGL